jgi:hypothetical protein
MITWSAARELRQQHRLTRTRPRRHMIKTDDSLDQLCIQKTTRISTALVQLQRQPARGGAPRRGQLPGVLQRRNLIQPGWVIPVFFHRRGVEDFIEHVFEYNIQPSGLSFDMRATGRCRREHPQPRAAALQGEPDWSVGGLGAHYVGLRHADRPG